MLSAETMTDVLEVETLTKEARRNLPQDCVTFEQFKKDYFLLLKQRYETI